MIYRSCSYLSCKSKEYQTNVYAFISKWENVCRFKEARDIWYQVCRNTTTVQYNNVQFFYSYVILKIKRMYENST